MIQVTGFLFGLFVGLLLYAIFGADQQDWLKVVSWLRKHRENFDIIGKAGEVYLRRVWLLGKQKSGYALMLHQMNTPDKDRFPHDHPWSFLTLVLWGGYVEETPKGKNYIRPWTIHYRPATYIHRITLLPRGRAFTLVFRWKYERSWGFWTELGTWVYWRNFLGMDFNDIKKWSAGEGKYAISVNHKPEPVSEKQWKATETTGEPDKKWVTGAHDGLGNNLAIDYWIRKNGVSGKVSEKEYRAFMPDRKWIVSGHFPKNGYFDKIYHVCEDGKHRTVSREEYESISIPQVD